MMKGKYVTAFIGLISIKEWLKLVVLPQICPPGTCECELIWKKCPCSVIKLRILRWDYPGLRQPLNPMTCVLLRDRKEKDTERREDGGKD